MADQKLVEFIKETRRRGFEDSVIINELIKNGWPENEIDAAFDYIAGINKKEFNHKSENQITIFLDDELLGLLEKRAKKNMLTVSELIEGILRRSTINQKTKKTVYDEKLDDKLIAMFSRKRTGPKKKN